MSEGFNPLRTTEYDHPQDNHFKFKEQLYGFFLKTQFIMWKNVIRKILRFY